MVLFENEWFIQAPWGRICIVAWGDCRDPPVLVCHGNIDSAACFRPLIALLPKNFYYVGMELPGNGKSDHFPPGMIISSYDMMYSIVVVARHFRWEKFIYLAHSFGSTLGKMYALAFPGKLSKLIEIDPINQVMTIPPKAFTLWFQKTFSEYVNKYDKYDIAKGLGPTYKKDEAIEKLVTNRSLTKETASATIERWTKPVGDGLIKYMFDQRLKILVHYPMSTVLLKELYTSIETPTLTIVAKESLDNGSYKHSKFLLDEKLFPAGNCRVKIVMGHHDIHVVHPERMAPYISNFLLYGLNGLDEKARL
ncbi:unnamed protein product, partial [Iphiclides podalirius]